MEFQTSATGPSALEWEFHRDEITRLYFWERMRLPTVAQWMENAHGFRASRRMYRTRLDHWGPPKKVSRDHTIRILRLLARQPLKPSGRPSDLVLQQTRLEEEARRVTRYLRRLQPGAGNALLQDLQVSLVKDAAASWTPRALTPPRTPDEMRLPNDTVLLLKSYVQGTCDTGIWPRDEVLGFAKSKFVPDACAPIMSAAWVLSEGGARKEVGKFLNQFIDRVPELLRRPDPLVFLFIYTSVLFFTPAHPGTARLLLFEILQKSESFPWGSTEHPLRIILRLMYLAGPDGIHRHARDILFTYVRLLEEVLGGTWPFIQDIFYDAVHRILGIGLIDGMAAADIILSLHSAARAQGHHRTTHYLDLQRALGLAYLRADRVQQARSTLLDIFSDEHAAYRRDDIRVLVNMALSKTSAAEGKMDEAVMYAEAMLEESRIHFGGGSEWELNGSIFLRKALERAGRMEEAERVVKERDRTIHMLEEKLSALEVKEEF